MVEKNIEDIRSCCARMHQQERGARRSQDRIPHTTAKTGAPRGHQERVTHAELHYIAHNCQDRETQGGTRKGVPRAPLPPGFPCPGRGALYKSDVPTTRIQEEP